jgi:hypothetical protein
MSARTKLVDKIEGVENLCSWNYRISLILEENELTIFIKENVPEPVDAAAKEKHQKDTGLGPKESLQILSKIT